MSSKRKNQQEIALSKYKGEEKSLMAFRTNTNL